MVPRPRRLKIAVLDDFQDVASTMGDWPSLDAEIVFYHDHVEGDGELIQRLEPFDVVVVMRERTALPGTVLRRLPNLRLIVTTGMRNGVIDFAAAADRGVIICGTRSLPTGVVELTWALILSLARHITTEDQAVRSGEWQVTAGMALSGKTLGLVGLGKLGSRVATIAQVFGMEILAWSPHLTVERAAASGATLVAKADLFAAADVVSIHLVLGPGTRGLVGERELRAMRPSAFLVNTSRGPIVQEAALLQALRGGWIGGAGIDVYDEEPLPIDHPLRSSPRTILTPHLGYVTDDNYRLFYGDAIEDIRAFATSDTPIRQIMTSGW